MKHAIRTAAVLASLYLCSGAGATVVTYDIAGAQYIYPAALNDEGQLTGAYEDIHGIHGYLRLPSGKLTTFDVPGRPHTAPVAISRSGVITGYSGDYGQTRGFIRATNGGIKGFKIVKGGPTEPLGGNENGWIVGYFRQSLNGVTQAFLKRSPKRTTEFTVPGATSTLAMAVNSTLTVAGETSGGNGNQGFIRMPDGIITVFGDPESQTTIAGINDDGTIAGTFTVPQIEGFVRTIDGTITTFVAPNGALLTVPEAINNSGIVAGVFKDGGGILHGFLRAADGTFTPFDPEGSSSTAIDVINDEGVIAGTYTGPDGFQHGFAGTP